MQIMRVMRFRRISRVFKRILRVSSVMRIVRVVWESRESRGSWCLSGLWGIFMRTIAAHRLWLLDQTPCTPLVCSHPGSEFPSVSLRCATAFRGRSSYPRSRQRAGPLCCKGILGLFSVLTFVKTRRDKRVELRNACWIQRDTYAWRPKNKSYLVRLQVLYTKCF